MQAPILRFPDFDRDFVVTTDADATSVGAVLEQDFGRGLQPIAYASRKLTPPEQRYSAYERELLGIVWAVGQWRQYLEGKPFTVRTDHSSLRHFPNQPSVNRRIWKWVNILQGYDMKIDHIPGAKNPADALTRKAWFGKQKEMEGVKQEEDLWMRQWRNRTNKTEAQLQETVQQMYQQQPQVTTDNNSFTSFNSLSE